MVAEAANRRACFCFYAPVCGKLYHALCWVGCRQEKKSDLLDGSYLLYRCLKIIRVGLGPSCVCSRKTDLLDNLSWSYTSYSSTTTETFNF